MRTVERALVKVDELEPDVKLIQEVDRVGRPIPNGRKVTGKKMADGTWVLVFTTRRKKVARVVRNLSEREVLMAGIKLVMRG